MIDRSGQAELSLSTQAGLLGISRSSLYYKAVAPSEEEICIKHRLDELYTEYPFFGSRRMTACLQREGFGVNRKRIQRYLREMGLEAIYPHPKKLSPGDGLEHRIYPYLLNETTVVRPNQVWAIDITYIRLAGGWLYLTAVLDWYSRYVISWEIDSTLAIGFVMEAVNSSLAQAQPEIFNSDQGSHFTSAAYLNRLREAQIQISMDGRGRCFDNIFIERLWRTVKYEEVYLKNYETPRLARTGLTDYFKFYNRIRPHQSLSNRTPAEVYFEKKN